MPRKIWSASSGLLGFNELDSKKPVPKPNMCRLCKHHALAHPGSHEIVSQGTIRSCYGCAKEMHEGKRDQDKICELTQYEVLQCGA